VEPLFKGGVPSPGVETSTKFVGSPIHTISKKKSATGGQNISILIVVSSDIPSTSVTVKVISYVPH
jgi:hypothetical protein